MVGLLDIAPSFKTVKVGEQDVAVPGISAQGIAYLLERFPELKEMMGGGTNVNAQELMTKVPEGIAAIIACGTGYVANSDAEAFASSLSLETQLDMLEAIIAVTMPKGVGPFIEKVERLMKSFGDVRSAKMPGTVSPSASSS